MLLSFGGCQGPSHGGSYMDEGMSHIRIRLLHHIALRDCLASVSCSMLHSLLLHHSRDVLPTRDKPTTGNAALRFWFWVLVLSRSHDEQLLSF